MSIKKYLKLCFILIVFFTVKYSTAQCFTIKSFKGLEPLNLQDTIFIEDLIGEGQDPSPKVLSCFVFKYSEWNYLITYKLTDCEKLYVIKDGYIGPIYIYQDNKVTILTED